MTDSKLFFRPKPKSYPALRLFIFPYAGGSAHNLFPWFKHIEQSNLELVFIQPPGRGNRLIEPPHEDIESLLGELMREVAFLTETNFVFFGHSLGSRVAYYAICKLLQGNQRLPDYLFVSASGAAHLNRPNEPIHDLPEEEFISELKRLNGTRVELLENKELMELLLPMIRADFKISHNFVAPPVKVPVPIQLMHGQEDPSVSIAEMEAWQQLTTKETDLKVFEGGHFYIAQNSIKVAVTINSLLKNVPNKSP